MTRLGEVAGAPPGQIGLPLRWPPARHDDFFVTDANRDAAQYFDRISTWPVMATILTGSRRSGRSLLGERMAARTGGRVFDRAESHDEEALFHAWNHAQEVRRPLILIADAGPPAWAARLPDLASRLAATPVMTIGEPDDALFAVLMPKLLAARGLNAGPELTRYLAARIERSYLAMHRVVETLDGHLFSAGGRLSIPTARRALEDTGVIDPVKDGSADDLASREGVVDPAVPAS